MTYSQVGSRCVSQHFVNNFIQAFLPVHDGQPLMNWTHYLYIPSPVGVFTAAVVGQKPRTKAHDLVRSHMAHAQHYTLMIPMWWREAARVWQEW
jgi:hypothetical protein